MYTLTLTFAAVIALTTIAGGLTMMFFAGRR